MIDIENIIINSLTLKLREYDNTISVKSEYVETPATFPTVTVEEADNYTDTSTLDTNYIENMARVMYAINIFTSGTTPKAKAKAIAQIIDNEMETMGFIRIAKLPLSAGNEPYRLVMRYRATVDKNKNTIRR